ncbi:hypothetical protein L7F22_048431 [Adiantum nelumboides]|nr:hypothetical protein [Adiantum nelumboides]
MVLKDKKTGAPKRNAKAENEGALILSGLENPHASNVLPSLKSFLEPVHKLQVSSGKENTGKHHLAKQFVPFLAQVLKLCSKGLSDLPSSDKADFKMKTDELFLCLEFALDCFEHLRQWLVGSPFEIEMQRSWLIRRYIASRRFREASDQVLQLLCSLWIRVGCQNMTTDHPRSEGCKRKNYNLKLPHPDHVKDLAQTVIVLIIGAATDFVVCAAEIGLTELIWFEKVIVTTRQLEPWLRKLDEDKAEKQRSLLFRELNKCVMAVLSDSSHTQTTLVESLSSLTLHQCALSSMSNHFCKVARSICTRLSSQGLQNAELAIRVCEEALLKIGELHELQGVRGSQEMLELVECYARLCHTNNKNVSGWEHIRRATDHHIEDTPAMALAGYYAAGLILSYSSLDSNCPQSFTLETYSTDDILQQSICTALKVAIKVARQALVLFNHSSRLEPANTGNEKSKLACKRESKSLVNLYRALDFFRRSACSYAQTQWDAFIARNQDFHMQQELLGTLRECLLLFCESLNAGLGCDSLTPDDSESFRKGSRSYFFAAIAALKLSLLGQDGSKESIRLICDNLSASFAGPEELKWLLSSSYNMGVQLFNMKLHGLACDPFKISYAAAWERVIHGNCKAIPDTSDAHFTEFINLISDACTKSNVLFDTLIRINFSHEALELFRESMVRWARTGLAGVKRDSSFLQLWLKKVFSMKLIKDGESGENLMCSFILQCHPPLPPAAVGLLLEEELSFYNNMEDLYSSLTLKKNILDLLQDTVYTTDSFFLQQSRVLQEKGKLCRLDGVEGYHGCLNYLTQAIDILVKNMKGSDDNMLAHAKLQLAMDYFLKACCLQEIEPSGNKFLEDIFNGSRICEDLFSGKPVLDELFLAQLPTVTRLLLNVADLLAFKGYSSQQYCIYSLLLDIASASHADPEEAFARVFEDRKLTHMFCCSPFLPVLKDLVRQKLGLDLDSRVFLENFVRTYPNTLLTGFLYEALNGYEDVGDHATSYWTEMARNSDNSKTIESMFKASQALFVLAERRRISGSLEEAFRNAKEALRFRLKLLNRNFKISRKLPLTIDAKVDGADTTQRILCFDAIGSVAVKSWPDMNFSKKPEVGPSHWQIMCDYLESLMQAGVISEMLGMVDDAESSFREGCQMANSLCLPFAEGLFQSGLGEIQRKRHLWELSISSFDMANQLLDQCVIGSICEQCIQLAKVSLDIRNADLKRHQNLGDPLESKKASKLALDGYKHAEDKLSCLVVDHTSVRSYPDVGDLQHNSRVQDVGSNVIGDLSLRSISSVEDIKPSRQIQMSTRSRGLCLDKGLTCVEENRSKWPSKTSAEIQPCRMPEVLTGTDKHSIPNNRYRTRRQAAAKPQGVVALPDDTIEELCVEACMKLNVQNPKKHVEKSQSLTKRETKQSTRRKFLAKHSVDEVNTDRALAEGLSPDKPVTKAAEPLEQLPQSLGSRKPCRFHGSCRAQEKRFSLQNWIYNRYVLCGRRLLARVFLQKGKCLIDVASPHEVHIQFFRALTVLGEGDWSVLEPSCPSPPCGLECLAIGASKHLGIEEGSLYYHIGMYALRQETCNSPRGGCCLFESIGVSTASKWLYHAFFLCREMPLLLCKVARIIAILHVPKDLGGPFDCFFEGFQSSRTAPFFHQLSLGATTRQQHISTLDTRKSEKLKIPESNDAGQSIDEMQEALRVCPSTFDDLLAAIEEEIDLPCPAVCISLVDWEMKYLYGDLKDVCRDAWLLVSRFDTDCGPLSILLPCSPLSNRFIASQCPYNLEEAPSALEVGVKSAFENLHENFKSVLDESRQSTSGGVSLSSLEEKSRWWEWRMDLDSRLGSLLRGMEEVWLGPWKSLLLGKYYVKGSAAWKSSAETFKRKLELMTKAGPFNVDVIRLLLIGADSLSRGELEKGIACLLKWKMASESNKNVQSMVSENATSNLPSGESFSRVIEAFLESFETVVRHGACLAATSSDNVNSLLSCRAEKNLNTASHGSEELELYREPVVLVLDGLLQVLPWESLPVLRKNEVYRVPSLGCLKALLIQRQFLRLLTSWQGNSGNNAIKHEEQDDNAFYGSRLPTTTIIPTIDPCNAYFLLNPSGDLGSTQAAFEDMFRAQQGWEGKVGQVPTADEYLDGLLRHELFVYFGHGSGDQYLPERRMRKMDRCAAALLMGCSSGRLSPRGDYEPVGVPLWYLMAGCPTAIANLWDVTDGDIDRFSRVLLQNWLQSDITHDKVMSDFSYQSRDLQTQCQKGRRRGQKNCKAGKSSITFLLSNGDEQIPRAARTASHIGKGRNTCRLPNLIGASPVCYGIPTLVRKKTS